MFIVIYHISFKILSEKNINYSGYPNQKLPYDKIGSTSLTYKPTNFDNNS